MSRPTTRGELMERSASAFEALMEAAEAIDPGRRLAPSDYARGSIKDMLAHLDAWHRMFLEWERVGRTGEVAEMPAPGYTWKTTPELNMVIHQRHADDPWEMVVVSLRESHAQARGIVESYTDDELFEKQRYRWTGSTSVGSYAVSATTSHYDWAMRHLKRSRKAWAGVGGRGRELNPRSRSAAVAVSERTQRGHVRTCSFGAVSGPCRRLGSVTAPTRRGWAPGSSRWTSH